MRTVIVYASTKGAVREIAEGIAELIGSGAEVHDLGRRSTININLYDRVVLGDSIHAGKVQRSMRRFVAAAKDDLLAREFALFFYTSAWKMPAVRRAPG